MPVIRKIEKKHPIPPGAYWSLNLVLAALFLWTFGKLLKWW